MTRTPTIFIPFVILWTVAVGGEPDRKTPAAYAERAARHDVRREFAEAIDDYTRLIESAPDATGAYQRRGEDFFRVGRFKESVADFDKVIERRPEDGPHHWQRGISLYYAGDYAGGARQFEAHRAVNPDDVENAAWHYLCVARTAGVEKARAALIPIKGDARVPMAEVHSLFAGRATPDDVLAAARAGDPPPGELKRRLFYAHLYVGLFLEAAGKVDAARDYIALAAKEFAGDDYMGDVARAHAATHKSPTTREVGSGK